MADELTLKLSLSFTKDGVTTSKSFGPTDFDVTGDNPMVNVQDVGYAAEEALLLGDAGVGGVLYARNLDATNFVEIRAGSGLADLVRLKPGMPCLIPLASDCTPYVLADTAACKLEYCLIPA